MNGSISADATEITHRLGDVGTADAVGADVRGRNVGENPGHWSARVVGDGSPAQAPASERHEAANPERTVDRLRAPASPGQPATATTATRVM